MSVTLWIVASATALIGVGFLYQWIGGHRDRRRFAGTGRRVTIGRGYKLYLLEKGSKDLPGPTVLFEAGIAATNLNWFHIQETVSRFAGTASYDRGGLGWSSPARTARTPGNIAVELHDMLERAGIKPPYVLVGHSFGGLVMRRYALLFPEEVSGVVLVDPMRCEEWPPLNPDKQFEVDRGCMLSRVAVVIARLGITRLAVTSLLCGSGKLSSDLASAAGPGCRHLLKRVTKEVGKLPREVWPIVAAHWSRPGYYAGMHSHVKAVPDTVREMQDAEPIRDIPVTLLVAGESTPLSSEDLGRIGDHVRQVVASGSAHWIHLDQPDLVIDSIREMVTAATPVAVASAAFR